MGSIALSTSTAEQIDARGVAADQGIVVTAPRASNTATQGSVAAGGYSQVTILDAGVIDRAFQWASDFAEEMLGTQSSQQSSALAQQGQLLDVVQQAAKDDNQSLPPWVIGAALAAVALVAYFALRKG